MKPLILEAKEIQKTFFHPHPITILKAINLILRQGETLAIVGPSGCGKSTLLQILGTLEKPSSGELTLFGNKNFQKDLSQIRSTQIGFIFQSNNLLEEYTLLENLLIKARIARRCTKYQSEAYLEAIDLLRRCGLSHRKDFCVKYLSGGEKQRAAIARALMNSPSLILADEPTGNLDHKLAKEVQEILMQSCELLQKSLIVVTHDLTFASACKRRLELQNGVLQDVRY